MNTSIPTWRERQKRIHSKEKHAEPAQISGIARRCVTEGRLQEALEYASAAKDEPLLNQLEQLSVDEGDAFLLAGIERLSGKARSAEQWNKLGYRAMELGKYAFARRAFERTENELMLAKIRGLLGEEPVPDDSQP